MLPNCPSAVLGDRLGTEMLLQRDREVGARLHTAVVGDDHRPVSVYPADARDHPPADYIRYVGVVHAEAGEHPQLEKRGPRIDEFRDEVPYQLLVLFCQFLDCLLPAGEHGLLHSIRQLLFFGQPVVPVRRRQWGGFHHGIEPFLTEVKVY